MSNPVPAIAVLGASGLIGEAVTRHLLREGFRTVPIARRFSPAQQATFGPLAIVDNLVSLKTTTLECIFTDNNVDIVINCVGVLQDSRRGDTRSVHQDFVERLVKHLSPDNLLIHLSIPGNSAEDLTPFSQTKRAAEAAITAASVPFVILRPGFVLAQSAYGGSALMRALALLPLTLSPAETAKPFATTDIDDIARSIAIVAHRWRGGDRLWHATWDVMQRHSSTVGQVITGLGEHLGGPKRRIAMPSWLLSLGARAGDLIAHLGWSPPIRTTALQEMRRGVAGNPDPWIAATGLEPATLPEILQRLASTIQERWFARLYLAKPLILATLALFWASSGLIALTAAFGAATAILTDHSFSLMLAKTITVVSSLIDISIGLAIAVRPTCRSGLLAGIAVSLFYMAGAALLTPELWLEPLGALVKTGPAIVLMIVALATLDNR